MKMSKAVATMLEDIVAYANVKQAELVQSEPANLDFPCRPDDLAILACAIGRCIQGADYDGQIGSTYTWEDASFIQADDEEFNKRFENLLEPDYNTVIED